MLAVQFERGVGNLSGPLIEHIATISYMHCLKQQDLDWTFSVKYLFLFSQLICALAFQFWHGSTQIKIKDNCSH